MNKLVYIKIDIFCCLRNANTERAIDTAQVYLQPH